MNGLKVANNLLSICLLLIDDTLEHVELLIHLLGDLFLKTFLIEDPMLHIAALAKIIIASLVYFLQALNMLITRLFERESLPPLLGSLEIAIIAQGCVA